MDDFFSEELKEKIFLIAVMRLCLINFGIIKNMKHEDYYTTHWAGDPSIRCKPNADYLTEREKKLSFGTQMEIILSRRIQETIFLENLKKRKNMKCKKHPNYKGIQSPNQDCIGCIDVWIEMHKHPPIKTIKAKTFADLIGGKK